MSPGDRTCRYCETPLPPNAHANKVFCGKSCKSQWHQKYGDYGRGCQEPGCGRIHYAKGYCKKHYRWRHESKYFAAGRSMTCEWCEQPLGPDVRPDRRFCSHACKMKWHRRHGAYTPKRLRKVRNKCSFKDCCEPVHAHGLCRTHSIWLWRYGNLDYNPWRPKEKGPCAIEGCQEVEAWKGLCRKHYMRQYLVENYERFRINGNARRSRQKNATPPWADMKRIKAIYRLAAKTTLETGIDHHVDHVIPLRGKRVCGLHVHTNLKVIPASINRRKSNRFE